MVDCKAFGGVEGILFGVKAAIATERMAIAQDDSDNVNHASMQLHSSNTSIAVQTQR